jgi:hypothetical protein
MRVRPMMMLVTVMSLGLKLIKKVTDALMAFSGSQPQFDDITLMILKVTE